MTRRLATLTLAALLTAGCSEGRLLVTSEPSGYEQAAAAWDEIAADDYDIVADACVAIVVLGPRDARAALRSGYGAGIDGVTADDVWRSLVDWCDREGY